jgi:hypothetical protein
MLLTPLSSGTMNAYFPSPLELDRKEEGPLLHRLVFVHFFPYQRGCNLNSA